MADGLALAIALAQYVQLKVFFGKVLRLAHFYETLSVELRLMSSKLYLINFQHFESNTLC